MLQKYVLCKRMYEKCIKNKSYSMYSFEDFKNYMIFENKPLDVTDYFWDIFMNSDDKYCRNAYITVDTLTIFDSTNIYQITAPFNGDKLVETIREIRGS